MGGAHADDALLGVVRLLALLEAVDLLQLVGVALRKDRIVSLHITPYVRIVSCTHSTRLDASNAAIDFVQLAGQRRLRGALSARTRRTI